MSKRGPKMPAWKDVENVIVDYMLEHGYPPTKSDVAEALGVVLSTAERYLRRMEAEGMIQRSDGGRPRTLQVKGVYYVDNRSAA